ncbi:MAG: hypothetical protein QM472_02780 [Spirochaetota bacterium]|nr:hypothetical protein [Spirochaetota bacterium]HPV96736.1 hypothetical protein [Spirochaetota bacterium]
MKRAVLLILLVLGCASVGRVNDDPVYGAAVRLMGSSQEEVVLNLGAPHGQRKVQTLDILSYCYGCRDVVTGSGRSVRLYGVDFASHEASVAARYDKILHCYFKANSMVRFEMLYGDGTRLVVDRNDEKNKRPTVEPDFVPASVEDLRRDVYGQAIKEMSREDIERALDGVSRSVARQLTIEDIRKLREYGSP